VEIAPYQRRTLDSVLHDPSLLGRATEGDRNALDHAGLHLDGAGTESTTPRDSMMLPSSVRLTIRP
jgi:hypothetical protein